MLEVRHLLDANMRLLRRTSPDDGSVIWKSEWAWSRGHLVSVRGVVVRKELRAWGCDENHGRAYAVDRLGGALGAVGTGLSANTQVFLRLRDCATHDYIDVYMDLHKVRFPEALPAPVVLLTPLTPFRYPSCTNALARARRSTVGQWVWFQARC